MSDSADFGVGSRRLYFMVSYFIDFFFHMYLHRIGRDASEYFDFRVLTNVNILKRQL